MITIGEKDSIYEAGLKPAPCMFLSHAKKMCFLITIPLREV